MSQFFCNTVFYGLFDRETECFQLLLKRLWSSSTLFYWFLFMWTRNNSVPVASCFLPILAFHRTNFEKKLFLSLELLQNSNSSPYSFPWLYMILVFLAMAVAHINFLSFHPLLSLQFFFSWSIHQIWFFFATLILSLALDPLKFIIAYFIFFLWILKTNSNLWLKST